MIRPQKPVILNRPQTGILIIQLRKMMFLEVVMRPGWLQTTVPCKSLWLYLPCCWCLGADSSRRILQVRVLADQPIIDAVLRWIWVGPVLALGSFCYLVIYGSKLGLAVLLVLASMSVWPVHPYWPAFVHNGLWDCWRRYAADQGENGCASKASCICGSTQLVHMYFGIWFMFPLYV